MNLSKIIKFHRKRAKISQERLAKLAGIGKTAVFDIEKGKVTVRFDTIIKILNVLNIKIEFQGPLLNEYFEDTNEKS